MQNLQLDLVCLLGTAKVIESLDHPAGSFFLFPGLTVTSKVRFLGCTVVIVERIVTFSNLYCISFGNVAPLGMESKVLTTVGWFKWTFWNPESWIIQRDEISRREFLSKESRVQTFWLPVRGSILCFFSGNKVFESEANKFLFGGTHALRMIRNAKLTSNG